MESTMQLVNRHADGQLTTTSLIIADGTGVQHKNVLETVKNNRLDFEEFGRVAFEMRPFETAGGPQSRTVAILNEEQATLLMTYMRNTPVVREFKKNLVRAFYDQARANLAPALTEDELVHQALQITHRKVQALEARNIELETLRESDAPKVEYHDEFVKEDDLIRFRTVAASVGIGEAELREFLIDRKYIYRESMQVWRRDRGELRNFNRYSAHARYKKYFHPVLRHDLPKFKGETMHTLKITPAGAHAIARLIKRVNIDGEVA